MGGMNINFDRASGYAIAVLLQMAAPVLVFRSGDEPLYGICRHRPYGNGAGNTAVGGTSQLGGDPVRHWGRAFIRIATSSRLRATSHGAPRQCFHAQGRVRRLMIG